MKKRRLALLVAMAVIPANLAQAEVCYRMWPFIDILRLSVRHEGTHQFVFGSQIARTYTMPVIGTREFEHLDTTRRRLSFNGINTSDKFGGNMQCTTSGVLSREDDDTFYTICTGGGAETFYNFDGWDLQPVNCDLATVAARSAKGRQIGD
jgi:hypothetical protein